MLQSLKYSAIALALTAGVAASQTRLDMTHAYEPGSIHGQGDRFFADKVNELSKGDLVLALHSGGALGFESRDHLDAVGDGVVSIADTPGSILAGSEPLFLISSLPFIAANPAEARKLYLAARPAYETFFTSNGQILLYASPWPPSGLWGKKSVDTVDALTSLKVRTYDANGTKTLIHAEALPIQLSSADVVLQLVAGGIEAVLTSAEDGMNAKFREHLSHFTEINYAMKLNFVHMNAKTFARLSRTGRKAIMDAAGAADTRNWKAMVSRISGNYVDLKANGVTIVEKITPDLQAHLSKAAGAVLADWKARTGAAGAKILKIYGLSVGRRY